MTTKIRILDGLPIEEQELDDEGLEKQQQLGELVMAAYEKTGTLTDSEVRDSVERYETEIVGHVIE